MLWYYFYLYSQLLFYCVIFRAVFSTSVLVHFSQLAPLPECLCGGYISGKNFLKFNKRVCAPHFSLQINFQNQKTIHPHFSLQINFQNQKKRDDLSSLLIIPSYPLYIYLDTNSKMEFCFHQQLHYNFLQPEFFHINQTN